MFTLCPTLRCKSCRGFALSLALFFCRLRSFAQRLRSCSKIRHVKCSEMYPIVILNPKKTKASAEERGNVYTWLGDKKANYTVTGNDDVSFLCHPACYRPFTVKTKTDRTSCKFSKYFYLGKNYITVLGNSKHARSHGLRNVVDWNRYIHRDLYKCRQHVYTLFLY
jgi:hypothetical protein